MKIYDVTVPLSPGMPVWPGDPPLILEQVSSMEAGAHANVSRMECSVHSGTHVDAPHHFLNDHRTVDGLSLDLLIGPVQVAQIPDDVNIITSENLNKLAIPPETLRLLLKTRNSHLWEKGINTFEKGFVGLSPDAAEWLVQTNIKLVGIDYLSIAPFNQSVPTHQVLLKPGIIILEGLDLSAISPGGYTLYCLPLNLSGSDGAPARVILTA